MVENKSLELTEDESELYDRQIRLWGLDSQKRLRAARVLLCGLGGFGAEIAKNLILAGIKSIKFLDHRNLTETDFCSQFLAPRTELGKNRAECSLIRAQNLNSMVEISADTEELASKSDEYFHEFDVIVVTEAITIKIIRIDEICRLKKIKFFCGDVWGMFGYSCADLQEHNFVVDIMKHKIISKPGEPEKTALTQATTKRTITFPAIKDVFNWNYLESNGFIKKFKRTGPSFLIWKILQKFRDDLKRDPCAKLRTEDLIKLTEIRDELYSGDNQSVGDLIKIEMFSHCFAQISPVAAIVGGELAHEIIKSVSQKEAPHKNFVLFDPEKCCGFVECIGEVIALNEVYILLETLRSISLAYFRPHFKMNHTNLFVLGRSYDLDKKN